MRTTEIEPILLRGTNTYGTAGGVVDVRHLIIPDLPSTGVEVDPDFVRLHRVN